MKRWSLRREVKEGIMFPKFYGLAYRDMWRRVSICYPIPLNVVVRLAMSLYWKLQEGLVTNRLEKIIEKAWQDGYCTGTRRNVRWPR